MMEIIVCVKQVPDLTETDVKINPDGKTINLETVPLDINELDNYALEEALLIKEKLSGRVIVVTLGTENADAMLRMCLAKGADEAVRIQYNAEIDGYLTAKLIATVINNNYKPDLILTGVQSSDYGYALTGSMISEFLNITHASIVCKIEIKDNTAIVHREVEAGLKEVVEIKLPAVFTIQSGINELRYASLTGIRKSSAKRINVLKSEALCLTKDELKLKTYIENIFIPQKRIGAKIITGTTIDEITTKLVDVIKDKVVVL